MELRPYQKASIKHIFDTLKTRDKALVSLPCGAGKTVIFTDLVDYVLKYKPNFKAVVLVNRNILIGQTKRKFKNAVGVYSAGYGEKTLQHPITIASVQSLVNAVEVPEVDCVIVDECHSLALDSGQGKIVYKKLGKPKVIAFTATPYTATGEPIWGEKKFFPEFPCYERTMKQLTDSGYLAPIILHGESEKTKIDTSNVKKTSSDFVVVDLEKCILSDKEKITLQTKDIIKRTKSRKKTAILCVTIPHAEEVYKIFKSEGEKVSILHSKLSKEQQQQEKTNFMTGENKFIVSVMMLTTGWDMPELDCLAICRPTRSRVLFMQAVGRVARKAAGKVNGLVLDYGNIVPTLGMPYDIKAGKPRKDYEPPVKMCINCFSYCPTSAKKCDKCKHIFKVMCKGCNTMKNYGEACTCGYTQELDRYKNLTLKPSQVETIEEVDRIEILPHLARSGRNMVKVDYYKKMFGYSNYFVTDYIFENVTLEQVKEYYRKPTHVKVGKNKNGYMTIKQKYFEGVL